MTTKRAEDLLGCGIYFHWEDNMRMTLHRKGLLAHLQDVKAESEITEAWLVNERRRWTSSRRAWNTNARRRSDPPRMPSRHVERSESSTTVPRSTNVPRSTTVPR
ncbi:hypothetical protein PF003_g23687 [Phytophthora fragariae]|nr:hypothetical protein PF003_g23687 [Phytophthora fragariae]